MKEQTENTEHLIRRFKCVKKWKDLLFQDEITITEALIGITYEAESGFVSYEVTEEDNLVSMDL